MTRGRDESLRCEGGHSPEYHTVCWRTPTSSRYKEPLRPYHTDNRTRCCKLPSRGSVDRTPINTAHTAQYSLFTSAERILRACLKNCIFVRLKRVCHLVRTCLTLLLLSHLPFTTSTSSSSFTLPSTTTPEHALQSGQHDLLQEHQVHHQPLQDLPVDERRHQEPLWRETLQSGGNPRKTFSTGYEPKSLRLCQGSRG